MPAPEQLLELYLHLAKASEEQQRFGQREKFLVLAANVAAASGDSAAAEACRSAVVRNNPEHVLCKYESMNEALRSEDVVEYTHSLLRMYPFEKAEYLLDKYRSAGYGLEKGLGGRSPGRERGVRARGSHEAGERTGAPRTSQTRKHPVLVKLFLRATAARAKSGRAFEPLDLPDRPVPGYVSRRNCAILVLLAYGAGILTFVIFGMFVR
jgi:hypothetical protein